MEINIDKEYPNKFVVLNEDRLTRLYSSKTAKVWALIRMLLYLRIPPVKYNKSYLEYSIKNVMLFDDSYRNRWS